MLVHLLVETILTRQTRIFTQIALIAVDVVQTIPNPTFSCNHTYAIGSMVTLV